MNVTFSVPAGSALYGNQLCTPPGWIDILIFYVSNYLIHVGTVPLFPGEKRLDVYIALVSALLFPVIGVARGLDRIARCANLGKTPLEKAARAGALCMVVRDEDWTPSHAPAANANTIEPVNGPAEVKAATIAVSPVDLHDKNAATATTSSVDPLHPEASTTASPAVKQEAASPVIHTMFNYHNGDYVTLQAPWQRNKEIFRWFAWAWIGTEQSVDIPRRRELAAVVQLPPGYMLAFVPHDAVVLPLHASEGDAAESELSPSPASRRSVAKFLTTLPARLRGFAGKFRPEETSDRVSASESREIRIAPSSDTMSTISGIAQLIFGLGTLLQTAGPQVDRFGYAAFGLTVLPYVIMSIINTTATLFTPTYTSMYLVRSEVMDEALGHPDAHFEGMVGRIPKASSSSLEDYPEPAPDWHQFDNVFMFMKMSIPKDEEVTFQVVLDKEPPPIDLHSLPTASRFLWGFQGIRLQIRTDPAGMIARQRWVTCIPSHPPIARKLSLKGRSWPPSDKGRANSDELSLIWTTCIRLIVSVLCLIPIGILSHFSAGSSSPAERVISMLWLATGFIGLVGLGVMKALGSSDAMFMFAFLRSVGLWDGSIDDTQEAGTRPVSAFRSSYTRLSWQLEAVACLLFSAPAVAGLVMVGRMFSSFGTCMQIS